ncbi:MAG: hypothetical protein A3G76_12485 [Acidobacteria bacterium RIFCSPLOWO2_12_FULL_65_11]|nr:MAG: hypothetical protein A3G76_12485 [Acidobacteria bacterium RIFCSPLOWO2_12_FULL_65_11]
MVKASGVVTVTLALLLIPVGPVGTPSAQQDSTGSFDGLAPTNHPSISADLSQLWMAPDGARRAPAPAQMELVSAIRLVSAGNFTKALPVLSQASLREGPLGGYAEYYKGLAELRLGRLSDARRTFQALAAAARAGYLAEAGPLRDAEAAETLGDQDAALAILDRLSNARTAAAPDDILMRLGKAAKAVGDQDRAAAAFSRVYFEFPLGDRAAEAAAELEQMPGFDSLAPRTDRLRQQLGRAEQLFAAKRYAEARQAFASVRISTSGEDRDLVNLRVAECDYYLKRLRASRDVTRLYLAKAPRQAEAMFYHALAIRGLGGREGYFRLMRRLADEFPMGSWAEEALNSLATNFIQQDDDASADETFREMYTKFPAGRYAERAAWKIGWQAYKEGRYAETASTFEGAAWRFARSDYRPPWLYWAARAHELNGESSLAAARYTLVVADYQHSYYGRLALSRLGGRAPERPVVVDAPSVALPPNEDVIRSLLALGLYSQAIDELRYAQQVWGDSAPIQATLAWIYWQQGQSASGSERFTLYRSAINTMRRAYPQFMAAGGEHLPKDLQTIIFPVAYWDLIQKHAAERNLDPFLVAALVMQESTFVADIRSAARAVGLMQLLPSTARRYAKVLHLQYSSRLITNPEANVRMGTAYLADTVKEFGELHFALASYNAGERSVRRWIAERPGLAIDEFVDDIPFPETQNYVKKVLGMAEDYRRLYGPESTVATR